jgi:parallel beta-helix repeat protein
MGEESLYVRPEPVTLRVPVNGNIQEMVDFAQPGDTVVIPYGEYHQTVVIDINDFTLLGEPNADGDYPVLHGDGERSDGVIATGDNFEIGFLEVRHYKSNGILVEGSTGVHIHHVFVEDTGVYGIYPTRSTDILVEDSVAVGMHDAGIYVGKSADAVVRNNEAYGNVLGIEIENTVGADVYGNHVHDNSTGFLIDLLPNLPSKVSLNTKVHDNLIENNNLPNWAPPELTAAQAPAGSGIAILAADGVEVYDNVIRNNITAGIGVFNLYIVYNEDEIDVGPLPENNYIHDNEMSENGTDPQGLIKDMGIPGGDILWDGSGNGNNFDQEGASMFPPIAPTSEWSTASRRIHYHILNFLLKLVG